MALKYKIGDKVRIKSIDWYNENKDEDGIVELSTHIFTPGMSQFCGKVMTISDVFEDIDDNGVYYMEEIDYDWTDEMIEGLVEEKCDYVQVGDISNPIQAKTSSACFHNGFYGYSDSEGNKTSEWYLPEGYQFVDENGNVINATKIVLEKKKKEYPKTYEECCKVLGLNHYLGLSWNSYDVYSGVMSCLPKRIEDIAKKLESLSKLIICRDAYWKIAGKEMGLGKPWKPNYNSLETKYTIEVIENKVVVISTISENHILAFPTEEMRDAFYENFKELIEECKELL